MSFGNFSFDFGSKIPLDNSIFTVLSSCQLCNAKSGVLNIDFVRGGLTNGQVKTEFSNDNSVWRTMSSISISGGIGFVEEIVYDLNKTGKKRILIETLTDKYIRVSVKGIGTVDNSSISIKGIFR